MPLRKISDDDTCASSFCTSPEHDPPNMIVLRPGTYEHECPKCHRKQIIRVPRPPRCENHPGWHLTGRGPILSLTGELRLDIQDV